MNRRHVRTTAIGLILLAGAMAGCASQPTTPPAESVCAARAQLATSLDAFRAIDPASAEAGDYQFAWIAVRQAAGDLRDYAYQMADDQVTALNGALDELERAVDDLPEDASVTDAIAALQPQLADVRATLLAIAEDLDCQT